MADGLLGLGGTGGVDLAQLNSLLRPPDPLGAALAAMAERFATAGQASRLPTSTLGALGSALGGASTAATAANATYLDQAVKLQALKRSLMMQGYSEQGAAIIAKGQLAEAERLRKLGAGGAPVAAPAVPGAPATSAAAPAPVPAAAPVPGGGYDPMTGNPPEAANTLMGPTGAPPGFIPSNLVPGSPGTVNIGGRVYTPPPGGGAPDQVVGPRAQGGLLDDTGGAGAAVMPASFRLASLVAPAAADGAGPGATADPLDLIAKYESGGRNIRQQVVPESQSSASGPWQMLDSTFHEAAKKAGIDVSGYKSAEDAPVPLQRAVAQALYNDKGYTPWAPYNPRLAAAIGAGETAAPRGLLASGERRGDGGGDPYAGLLALAGAGGEDPLAGLLTDSSGKDPLASLLAADKGAVQPGPVDELISSGNALPEGLLQRAALPGRTEPAQVTPIDQTAPENLALTARVASDPRLALPGVPGMPQSLDEIASGATARSNMTLAQYAPGGGAPAAAVPPLSGVPPLVGPGAGLIPGLGLSPAQVAGANALFTLGGVNSPYKEFLDLYYKSPEYLRLSEQEKAAGKSAVETPATMAINEAKAMLDIRVGMAKDGVMIGPKGEVVPIPGHGAAMAYNADQLAAVKNKWETKLAETQAGFEQQTVTIRNSDGSDQVTTMSKAEVKRRQDMRGNRAAQPGDIVGTRVENPFDKFGVAKFGESFDAAQAAAQSLENNNRVQKLVDAGIITGAGANANLALQKLGAALGFTGHDQIARTEAFIAAMGTEVANVIKTSKLGPPTSDKDIEFARGISGGNIALDEGAIRRILRIHEDFSRGLIDKHNKQWAPYVPRGSMLPATILAPPPYGATTGVETDPQTGQTRRVWVKPDGTRAEY